jgi:mannose-6-phosphate isomerase-like protein (cupin superfamily)
MIHCFYREGQKLDVAGLNEITVLIDRSETEMTEIGWNCWRPDLDGPPHRHNDKDQVFYVTDGNGTVRLGNNKHTVRPGMIVYVPAGLIHQTITTGAEPLCYLLFNVFRSSDKEGHTSFADHIAKVKQIRKLQAETGNAGSDQDDISVDRILPGKVIDYIGQCRVYDFGSNKTRLLLDRTETNRLEFVIVDWPPGARGAMVAHKEKEQTFYILDGKGVVLVGDEKADVGAGDLVFVPRNTPHTTITGPDKLKYLCLNSIVTDPVDNSFDEMFRRIAPGRIRRWQIGDNTSGE